LSKVFDLQKYVLSQVEDDWLAAGGNNLGMKRTSENNGRAGEQRQEDCERAREQRFHIAEIYYVCARVLSLKFWSVDVEWAEIRDQTSEVSDRVRAKS
jgi:hypothetical protein